VKKLIPAIVLIAIAAYAVMNALHTLKAKADSQFVVNLPLIMNSVAGGQPSGPTPTPQPTTTPTVDPAQLKADAIAAVNAERAKAGCAPVSAQADLGNGAQAWADYLVAHNMIGHSFALDANWYVEHGYTRTDWVSENVAGGPSTGADVVALWMSDEGHKAVILAGCANTSHTFDIGVGFNNQAWTLAIGELHD